MPNKNNPLPTKKTALSHALRWRKHALYSDDAVATWQGLLKSRGLHESDVFFAPRLADLPDPDGMVDMDQAANRLLEAIMQGQHIHIFGDFDADGVCGTAILCKALQAINAHVTASIPHRSKDGHGIGVKAVQSAVADGCQLGISVDTGTVCFDACETANKLGLDIIVTDHHLPAKTLPPALALLNPARQDCGFAGSVLCGAGVAFFLLMATWKRLKKHRIVDYDLRQLLDRVAVATVADVMRLQGVNRTLVYHGLIQLSHRPSVGMAALLALTRLTEKTITSEHIGFQLAPRINAAGRMRHGNDALKLLLSSDQKTAMQYAKLLDECNQERRTIESTALAQAEERLQDSNVLAAYDPRWHAGVVGLVAGRLARKHGYPAAIGFVAPAGDIRVSLRGVDGFHIGDLLTQCSESLHHFGGHEGAGGGSIKEGCWAAFKHSFGNAIAEQQRQSDTSLPLYIDGILHLSALHAGLAERLQRFAPFGRGSPRCAWYIPQVLLTQRRELKGGVIRMQLSQGGHQVDAISFAANRFYRSPQEGEVITVIGYLQKDDWRGGDAIQFVIEDLLFSDEKT